ncbi:Putative oxidoreductase SadH [Variovorax sp. PBL-H6]|uniref:SDR family oxidoreductase n=1 Tax=Variovorax sp. PBL-H6 TaxID=434009 RepID=UPI0013187CBF|nr:SDR family oxidoreductase [Variovorax sp. PBL-H6]VTU15275.1 Putative oxidoreductase SadH [Variovorax sp. PBL-H6]
MGHRGKSLDKQVMVITGASSGIGLCTAKLAAEAGASLVLVARSTDVLEQLAAEIQAKGGRAVVAGADVAERSQIEEAARTAIQQFGRIDTWVNNAGVSIYGRLDEVSDEDSRRLFDINFWGIVNGSLTALPHLRKEGGSLINVGSEVSDAVVPLQGMYSASKHAVKGFTDALRVEVEDVDKAPVHIVLIQPTAVNTPYPEHARNYMDQEPKLPTPMIDPEDVAKAILKAATDGGRDVKVGSMSVLNTTMSKVLPSLADKMSAKQVDRQQRWEDPDKPQGTLYEAGHSGRTHGRPEAA